MLQKGSIKCSSLLGLAYDLLWLSIYFPGKKGAYVYWIFHIPSVSMLKSSQQNFQLGPMYPPTVSSLKPAQRQKPHEYFFIYMNTSFYIFCHSKRSWIRCDGFSSKSLNRPRYSFRRLLSLFFFNWFVCNSCQSSLSQPSLFLFGLLLLSL